MKIVILDGYTLNPGDMSWQALEALGDCAVYERTPKDQVLERAAGADIVLTNKVFFGREEIGRLPQLRYIGVTATGYNIVDVEAARQHNVTVTNVPAYSTASVAQLTFALLLELTQQVGHHARLVREGRWTAAADFCFWDRPLVELDGLTLGIVGFGAIGSRIARLARAFGMQVLVHTAHPEKYRETAEGRGVCFVGLDELFRDSDAVTLHCPLTEETRGMVGARRLTLMKPTAFLLNTSRGPLVDEAALAAALNAGRLAGAGLDVLSAEPPPADNPLLQAANCCITPHIAWATRAARERLMATAVANVRAFLDGKPQNMVS
jgi:glycerate dehydrogenase